MKVEIGDRVRVRDHSEAHGDEAVVDAVFPDGVVWVELKEFGCIWVCQAHELEPWSEEADDE